MNFAKPYMNQTHPMGNLGSPFVEPLFAPTGTMPLPQQQPPNQYSMNPNYDLERRMDQFEKWINNIADALSKVAQNTKAQRESKNEKSNDEKSQKSEQMISTKWFFVAVGLTNGIILLLFIVAFIAIVFVVKHMAMNLFQYQSKMMQNSSGNSFVQPVNNYPQNYNYLGQTSQYL